MDEVTTKEKRGGARVGAGRPKAEKKKILFQVRCNDDERQAMIKALNEYRLANGLRPHVPRTK